MVTQPSVWGGEDETFSLLDEALSTAFDITHIQDHVAKLRRTQADERHLSLLWICTTCPTPCSVP